MRLYSRDRTHVGVLCALGLALAIHTGLRVLLLFEFVGIVGRSRPNKGTYRQRFSFHPYSWCFASSCCVRCSAPRRPTAPAWRSSPDPTRTQRVGSSIRRTRPHCVEKRYSSAAAERNGGRRLDGNPDHILAAANDYSFVDSPRTRVRRRRKLPGEPADRLFNAPSGEPPPARDAASGRRVDRRVSLLRSRRDPDRQRRAGQSARQLAGVARLAAQGVQ